MGDGKWKKRWRDSQEQVVRLSEALAIAKAENGLLLRILDRQEDKPSDAVAIVRAFADVVNPRTDAPDLNALLGSVMTSPGANDLDNMLGVRPGENYPDVEFDDFMDPTLRDKEQGTWKATETMVPPGIPDPAINPNDGTPRFRAGSSGPLPVGGTE